MKSFFFVLAGAIIVSASVIAGSALGTYLYQQHVNGVPLGATTARTTITNQWTFSATTTMSKPLNITHTNTATSTIIVGCEQTYATSTATPLRSEILASASTSINGATQFLKSYRYGSCPNI